MIAIVVTSCRTCVFIEPDALYESWNCGAIDGCTRSRHLGEDAPESVPDWCPLRDADHLVTLRKP